jgi:hypothetical protein
MGWRLRTLRKQGTNRRDGLQTLLRRQQHAPAVSDVRQTAVQPSVQAVSRLLDGSTIASTDVF